MEEHSLRSEMQRNTFTDKDKIVIIIDLAKALALAHENNVIHRNVCPENIYVQADRHAALANFGLSYNVLHEEDKLNVSVSMDAFDRDPYTSEDVITGDYSPSSDVYSFGVIVYELMVGELPFANYLQLKAKGGSLTEDMMPSKRNSNVESWVDVVCSRTIVEDPVERWSNIEEICDYIFEEAIEKKYGHQE
jgi:serine/threonine protein kinase